MNAGSQELLLLLRASIEKIKLGKAISSPVPSPLISPFMSPFSLPLELLEEAIDYHTRNSLPVPTDLQAAYNQKRDYQGGANAQKYNQGYGYQDNLASQLGSHVPLLKPTYQKREIRAISENYLIQFIGGAKNAEQEYYPRKDIKTDINGVSVFKLPPIHQPIKLDENQSIVSFAATYIEVIPYKLTFLSSEETPFSEDQIVIAIFQEQKTT